MRYCRCRRAQSTVPRVRTPRPVRPPIAPAHAATVVLPIAMQVTIGGPTALPTHATQPSRRPARAGAAARHWHRDPRPGRDRRPSPLPPAHRSRHTLRRYKATGAPSTPPDATTPPRPRRRDPDAARGVWLSPVRRRDPAPGAQVARLRPSSNGRPGPGRSPCVPAKRGRRSRVAARLPRGHCARLRPSRWGRATRPSLRQPRRKLCR